MTSGSALRRERAFQIGVMSLAVAACLLAYSYRRELSKDIELVCAALIWLSFFVAIIEVFCTQKVLRATGGGRDKAGRTVCGLPETRLEASQGEAFEEVGRRPPRAAVIKLAQGLKVSVLLSVVLANALVAASSLELVRIRQTISAPAGGENGSSHASVSLFGVAFWRFQGRPDRNLHFDGGRAFVFPLETPALFWSGQDSTKDMDRSGATLYEDDRLLGPAHAPHDRIRQVGMGAYSHWGEPESSLSFIYFSTSDNASPSESGRRYTADYPLIIKPSPAAGVVTLGLLLLIFGFRRAAQAFRTLPPTSASSVSRLAQIVLFLLAIATFSAPVLASWSIARGNYSAIGGLLPWSDASGWFSGAIHLLSYGTLDWWTTRRPINPAFLGTLFFATGQDLRGLLLLQSSLVGVACFLAAREIGRTLGVAASLLSFAVLLSFGKTFVPTTLSESLGLLFGATGFALMWRAVVRREARGFAFGIFVLTLGLSARPGPLLILPALALWAVVGFQVDVRKRKWQPFAFTCVGILAGGAVTLLLTTVYGSGAGAPGANYSYVLYGLAHGGKQWSQALIDHPEWLKLSEAARANLTYRAALSEVFEHPANLLSGLALFWRSYLENLFSYVAPVLRAPVLTLSGIGLVFLLLEWKRRIPSFLLAGVFGMQASAPVLFYDADAYRTFVATVPFDAALAAVGLAVVIRILQFAACREPRTPRAGSDYGYAGAVALGVAMTLVCTVGLAFAIAVYRTPRFALTTCAAGSSSAVVHLGRTSPNIMILPDNTADESFAPHIRLSDFRQDESFAGVEISELLARIPPGTSLIDGWDLSAQQEGEAAPLWMVVSGSQRLQKGRYYQVCGSRAIVRYQGGKISMMEVDMVREVSPR